MTTPLSPIEVPGAPALSDAPPAGELPVFPDLEPPAGAETTTTEPPAATGEPPAKRKRVRRTKAQMAAARGAVDTPPAGPSPEDKAHLSNALGLGFDTAGRILASARGEHWRLSHDECRALGDAWAEALAPYLGQTGPYMPLFAAALVTVGVAAPRIVQDRAGAPRSLPAVVVSDLPAAVPVGETAAPPDGPTPGPETVLPIDPPPGRRAGNGKGVSR